MPAREKLLPRFTVEVADNGYILQVYTPEGEKTLDKTVYEVHRDLDDCFDAIRTKIGEIDH